MVLIAVVVVVVADFMFAVFAAMNEGLESFQQKVVLHILVQGRS